MRARRPAPLLDAELELLAELEPSLAISRLGSIASGAALRARVLEIATASTRRAQQDLDGADRLARLALRLARRTRDGVARGRALRAHANVRSLRRDFRGALRAYRSACEAFRKKRLRLEEAITRSGAIQTLIYLGKYELAADWGERARRVFVRRGDELRLARLEHNLANLDHRRDRFAEALAGYARAAARFRALGDSRDRAAVLHNMAVCQIGMLAFDDALLTYRELRSIAVEHRLHELLTVADYNVAYLYFLRGEYLHAIELYGRARERAVALGDAYHSALCDLDHAEILLELNLTATAEEMLERARGGFHRLGLRYEAAKAMTLLGMASGSRGDRTEALARLTRARASFRREGNRSWEMTIDLYRALIHLDAGDRARAVRLASGPLAAFRGRDAFGRAAFAQYVQARIEHLGGRAALARKRCQRGLELLRRHDVPSLSLRLWYLLGAVEEESRHEAKALAAYARAHQGIESLRSRLGIDELKVSFLDGRQEVSESLFVCLLRAPLHYGGAEAAFRCIEAVKSRSLADQLAIRTPPETDSDSAKGATPRPESDGAAPGPGRHDSDPDPRCIGLLLDDETRLVEYFEARGDFYACVLGRSSLEVRPVTSRRRLIPLLDLLAFQLSKFRLGPDYARVFSESMLEATNRHLGAIHDELLAPLEDLLADARRLVVVPHGPLHGVPFHALRSEGRYLIDERVVTCAPSATVFALCSREGRRPSGGALVLGLPDPLAPTIFREAEGVAAALPDATLALGSEATLERLRTEGADARLVHIATHGFFRRENPMFSSIQLADGELRLHDLYRLRLNADLVVLSGCATGLGVAVAGDELLGLGRGLLYAGARSALLSLWDVDDRSTTEFMIRFHRILAGGQSAAGAARTAMRAHRERYPHPYYWAPFVLLGSPLGS